MGIFSDIFSTKGTVDAAGDLIEKTGGVFDKLFTSTDEKLTHGEIMTRLKQRPMEIAHELNLINASGNWFNSGWRPGLGWVGVISLALFYIPQYFMAAIIWVRMCWNVTGTELPPYPVDAVGIMELVGLLIGGATLRTVERARGIAKAQN